MMMIGTREVIHHLRGDWAGRLTPNIGGLAAPPPLERPSRRREPRAEERKVCSYELCESIDEQAVVIQQGEAYTLNRSAHGILVLMGQAPRVRQLVELHIPEAWWRRSMNLFEVQWTKPVQIDELGELHLVGCRLTFGPRPYWTF